ncbi:hypothetical protein BLNAU_9479 [Blattamonas nauphoetae]|uniref:Uncharacterized protein n=1 Tax=Blattamonas nauphoetae TaxID=2049346 RepID=A0ABQ9XVV4_9EUKA|nr:hypothetical protein BLNAU_9479 [Blattamonas nauphoetae]
MVQSDNTSQRTRQSPVVEVHLPLISDDGTVIPAVPHSAPESTTSPISLFSKRHNTIKPISRPNHSHSVTCSLGTHYSDISNQSSLNSEEETRQPQLQSHASCCQRESISLRRVQTIHRRRFRILGTSPKRS